MKGTLPYWESLPMSVMPIRSPAVQVVPLARVAGAMSAVNWVATGHRSVLVVVVVVAGYQCEGERCKCKKSCLHYIYNFIIYKSAFTSSPFTSSQPLISAPSTSMPSGVSTSVPPRVSDSPFLVLNSLRASVSRFSASWGSGCRPHSGFHPSAVVPCRSHPAAAPWLSTCRHRHLRLSW